MTGALVDTRAGAVHMTDADVFLFVNFLLSSSLRLLAIPWFNITRGGSVGHLFQCFLLVLLMRYFSFQI